MSIPVPSRALVLTKGESSKKVFLILSSISNSVISISSSKSCEITIIEVPFSFMLTPVFPSIVIAPADVLKFEAAAKELKIINDKFFRLFKRILTFSYII